MASASERRPGTPRPRRYPLGTGEVLPADLGLGKVQNVVDQGKKVLTAVQDIGKIFDLDFVKLTKMLFQNQFVKADDVI